MFVHFILLISSFLIVARWLRDTIRFIVMVQHKIFMCFFSRIFTEEISLLRLRLLQFDVHIRQIVREGMEKKNQTCLFCS